MQNKRKSNFFKLLLCEFISLCFLSIGLLFYIKCKDIEALKIVRNFLPDFLWMIAFIFALSPFVKEVFENCYILISGCICFSFSVLFEFLQWTNIIKGTGDFWDLAVYFAAVITGCILIKNLYNKRRNRNEKTLNSILCTLLVLVFMSMAVASSSSAKTEGNKDEKSTSQENSQNEIPTYKLGEKVSIKTSQGEYWIRFNSVKETKDRNEFSDKKANKVVLISYDFENVSYENDLFISDMVMKLYDKDNNALETYPSKLEKSAPSVSKGRKGSGVLAYALNNKNNYIELEYYSNMFNSSADCKFVLQW